MDGYLQNWVKRNRSNKQNKSDRSDWANIKGNSPTFSLNERGAKAYLFSPC